MSWTGVKKFISFPWIRPIASKDEEDPELDQMQVLLQRRLDSLSALKKNLRDYPAAIKNVMREQREAVEAFRDVLRSDCRPSSPLGGASQKTLVALLELEHDLEPKIDVWLKDSGLLERISRLQKEGKELVRRQNKANKSCQVEPKEVVRIFLDSCQGEIDGCFAQLTRFQADVFDRWTQAFDGLSFLLEGQEGEDCLDQAMREALEKFRWLCNKAIQANRLETVEEAPMSPLDVPTELITGIPVSPKIHYQITKMRTKHAGLDELSQAFEALHTEHQPADYDSTHSDSTATAAGAPELPSGRSRVAALAAQLELSKIIFRPMLPTVRPKPKRDDLEDDHEEAQEYERNLGKHNPYYSHPSSPSSTSNKSRRSEKQEVPPKPTKRVYAMATHDFLGTEKGDLTFKRGDKIEVLLRPADNAEEGPEWWTGRIAGTTGLFPSNYTRPL